MSNTSISYFVGACAGVFSVAVFAAWVLVPAWSAYGRAWERVAAVFLSLYVFAAFVGIGIAGGAAVIWFWDSL